MTETGEVKFITGVVTAINENGARRILQIGDNVSASELIETSEAGAISIEFANGAIMDLGRNASSSYETASENPLFEKVNDVASQAETEATQQALLNEDETYDPTDPSTGLEAPGAGPTADGGLEDDGSTIVQNQYDEPRRTPENGFETEGINVQFPEPPPLELIQNPVQPVAAGVADGGAGAATAAAVVSPLLPAVDIFTISENQTGLPAEINAGQFKFFGLTVDPVGNDSITQIVINGFPEDGIDTTRPDWFISPRVIDSGNYDVKFQDYSLTPTGWQLTLDVNSATPGEEVEFLLNIGSPSGISSQSIPLDVTYANGTGLFSPSSTVTIDVENTASALNIA